MPREELNLLVLNTGFLTVGMRYVLEWDNQTQISLRSINEAVICQNLIKTR